MRIATIGKVIGLAITLSVAPLCYGEGGKAVLFFGDSLTAGFDISSSEAYPARIQELAHKEALPIHAINAGLSGDTSAGGLRRIDWFLKQPIDLALVALGANDGLRGLPLPELHRNLVAIVKKIQDKHPRAKIILAGMKLPPTYGADYVRDFSGVFPAVAKELNVPLYPFLLEGVAGDTRYNLPDLLHPNEAGHQIMAENIWKFLKPLLKSE